MKGCVPQFEKWLQDNLTVVAGIFIGIALLQVRTHMSFSAFPPPPLHPVFVDDCCFADFRHLFSAESGERHRSGERELVSAWVVSQVLA